VFKKGENGKKGKCLRSDSGDGDDGRNCRLSKSNFHLSEIV
jgi:hypothetical protein